MFRKMHNASADCFKWLMMSALMLACGSALAQADRAKWPARLTYATGPIGSFSHTTGSPWASLVGTEVGVPVSVEATAGFSINILMIDDGKADIAMTTSDLAYQGWEGAEW